MTVLAAILLIANAVWNVVVWPRFLSRVRNDPRARDAQGRPTAFLRVHVVLVAVSLVLAAASLIAAVALLAAG